MSNTMGHAYAFHTANGGYVLYTTLRLHPFWPLSIGTYDDPQSCYVALLALRLKGYTITHDDIAHLKAMAANDAAQQQQ